MYKCKGCGKRFVFTSLGGLSNSKLPVEIIIQIIKCMSNDETYKTTCLMLGINKKTAVFWRFLMFEVANEYMSKVVLYDRVMIDEKYVRSNDSDVTNRIKLRNYLSGLSKDQECVELAMDNHKNYIGIVYKKRGKVSSSELAEALHQRIKIGSSIIHDGDKSHRDLINFGLMKREEYKISKNKEEALKAMKPINNLCAYIENKLRKHNGIKTKNLQNYINWFLFLRAMEQRYHSYKDAAYHVIAHRMIAAIKTTRFSKVFKKKTRLIKKKA